MKDIGYLAASQRLCLRRIRPTDESALVGLLQDPDVKARFGTGHPSRNEVLAWMERRLEEYAASKDTVWALEAIPMMTLIGVAGLTPLEIAPGVIGSEVSCGICTEHRHRGFGTEALGLLCEYARRRSSEVRLIGLVESGHSTSKQMLHKSGFRFVAFVEARGQSLEMFVNSPPAVAREHGPARTGRS